MTDGEVKLVPWPRVNLTCVKVGEGCQGKTRGERRMLDRFPAGFMPLFFIRSAREDVVHRVTASGMLSPGVPFFSSVPLRFWHAARISRDINAMENTVESFNQSTPMTLGIWPCVLYNFETKLCTRPKWALLHELKNGSLSCQCSQSRAPVFVRGWF